MNPDGNRKRVLLGLKSVPYPLRADGVSVRYLPIIESMARRHDVDLLVIGGETAEPRCLEALRPYCRKIFRLQNPHRTRYGMIARCKTIANSLMPWTPPYYAVSHAGSEVTRGIAKTITGERYDAMVWVGSDLLPHLMDAIPSLSVRRVVVDFIDSPYLWAIRRKENIFRIGFMKRYEEWKTCRWEADVIREADDTIYISRVDADAVPPARAPAGKRHVLPNGINEPVRKPDIVPLPSPNIGFLGNMGYPPNIEAVEWLYREVFAPLRETRPDLTLVVIGRFPARSIRELGKNPGVIVTGEVDDIWGYIESIDVFLFPLLRGAGLKNKILEAMYGSRAVVTTEIGNEGIDAIPGKEIALCRTPEDFRREATRLLDSREERVRMGKSAHAFVKENFSWNRILSDYEDLVLGRAPAPGKANR